MTTRPVNISFETISHFIRQFDQSEDPRYVRIRSLLPKLPETGPTSMTERRVVEPLVGQVHRFFIKNSPKCANQANDFLHPSSAVDAWMKTSVDSIIEEMSLQLKKQDLEEAQNALCTFVSSIRGSTSLADLSTISTMGIENVRLRNLHMLPEELQRFDAMTCLNLSDETVALNELPHWIFDRPIHLIINEKLVPYIKNHGVLCTDGFSFSVIPSRSDSEIGWFSLNDDKYEISSDPRIFAMREIARKNPQTRQALQLANSEDTLDAAIATFFTVLQFNEELVALDCGAIQDIHLYLDRIVRIPNLLGLKFCWTEDFNQLESLRSAKKLQFLLIQISNNYYVDQMNASFNCLPNILFKALGLTCESIRRNDDDGNNGNYDDGHDLFYEKKKLQQDSIPQAPAPLIIPPDPLIVLPEARDPSPPDDSLLIRICRAVVDFLQQIVAFFRRLLGIA